MFDVGPTISRHGPSSCKEEVVFDMPVTDEDYEFLKETGDLRPTCVEKQRMIEKALQYFKKLPWIAALRQW